MDESKSMTPGELLEVYPSKLEQILHSRRFWTVVLAISAAIAVELFGFEPGQVERINQVVMVIAGIYIAGLSLEDAARQVASLKGLAVGLLEILDRLK